MSRRLLATLIVSGLVVLAARGDAAPDDPPPVPVVTLDVLPLAVPLGQLGASERIRAESVLSHAIFAQRVSDIRFPSREAVYRFLLDYPDFAASVARALRVGQYRVTSMEDGYWGDDGRGATGMVRLLYADANRRLYHLEGRYERRLVPTIEGQLLVLLEFHHVSDEAGTSFVEQSLTGHVRIDTPLIGAVAQVVGALSRSLVERTVEAKVRRFFATVARVSRWAYEEPEQVATALEDHPDVERGPTLTTFLALLREGLPPGWAHGPFRLASDATLRLDAGWRSPDGGSPAPATSGGAPGRGRSDPQ
jgi:hypothetical protein